MSRTKSKTEISLILHNVRSAYNVGSIFRTADGAGASKIHLCGYSPIPEDSGKRQGTIKIAKTALGAEKVVPWEYQRQTWRLLQKLKKEGVHIIALELTSKSKNLFAYKPPTNKPLAILVGHERRGLTPTILEYVDEILEIPMKGHKESLNVSVAVGIALFQLITV